MSGRHLTFAILLSAASLMNTGCAVLCGGPGASCGSACCGDSCGGACGSKYAFQRYQGCCDCGGEEFSLHPCVGPDCCDTGCEPACGCEPGCGVAEPGCNCEPSCGCADGCCGGGCCNSTACEHCGEGLVRALGRIRRAVFGPGCTGCDGEVYWSEWHNDPPRCCDPCSRCGQWTGPSAYTNPAGACNQCNPTSGYALESKPRALQNPPQVAKRPMAEGPMYR